MKVKYLKPIINMSVTITIACPNPNVTKREAKHKAKGLGEQAGANQEARQILADLLTGMI